MKKTICEYIRKVVNFLRGLNPIAYYTLWRWEKEMRKINEDTLLEEKKYWEEEQRSIIFDGIVDEVVAFWIENITIESISRSAYDTFFIASNILTIAMVSCPQYIKRSCMIFCLCSGGVLPLMMLWSSSMALSPLPMSSHV